MIGEFEFTNVDTGEVLEIKGVQFGNGDIGLTDMTMPNGNGVIALMEIEPTTIGTRTAPSINGWEVLQQADMLIEFSKIESLKVVIGKLQSLLTTMESEGE